MSREASGQPLLAAHYRVDGHPFINPIQVKCSFSTSKYKYSWKPCLTSGGGCWRQEHLPNVPPLPRRPPLVRQDPEETPGARCPSPLPSDRLRRARISLQGYCSPGSQVKKVRLHWRVKVRKLFTLDHFLPASKNENVHVCVFYDNCKFSWGCKVKLCWCHPPQPHRFIGALFVSRLTETALFNSIQTN